MCKPEQKIQKNYRYDFANNEGLYERSKKYSKKKTSNRYKKPKNYL